MKNPWLSVSVEDYEGHMGHESVGQTQVLADILRTVLDRYPFEKGFAYLGCATGTGMEHVDAAKTKRVVVVDINLNYLKVLRERYGEKFPHMELQCRDILRCEFPGHAFDHIHAGLLMEYVDPEAALQKIQPWLTDDGVLSVVLQLPAKSRVSVSPYPGVNILDPVIKLVPPDRFREIAARTGLQELESWTVNLPQEKQFHVGVYGFNRDQE